MDDQFGALPEFKLNPNIDEIDDEPPVLPTIKEMKALTSRTQKIPSNFGELPLIKLPEDVDENGNICDNHEVIPPAEPTSERVIISVQNNMDINVIV